MSTELKDRIEGRIANLLNTYRDHAAVLLLLTKDVETTMLTDPPTPTRDQIIALALKIQQQQLAVLRSMDKIVALLETYDVP